MLVNSDSPGFNVLRKAAEDYTTTQVIRASILSGKLIDINLIRQLVDPIATANQIFVKRPGDYYANIKAKFNLVITGEDTDIDWRLRSIGVAIKSVKYSAKLYHLHHEKGYSRSSINLEILRRTQDLGQSRCLHGINQRKISQ